MKLGVTVIALLMVSLTLAQGVWTRAEVCDLGNTVYRLRVADARGDGRDRVYCGTRSGSVYELSYERGAWVTREIGNVPNIAYDLVVAAGRGDRVQRVYVPCKNGHTYEFSYGRAGWSRIDMGGTNGGADMDQVGFGCGRNDGVMRGYVTLDNGHIWEFTWTDRSWVGLDIGRFADQLLDVSVGRTAHDDMTHLYVSSQAGALYEVTWTRDGWRRSLVDQFRSPRAAWGIELGRVTALGRPDNPDRAELDEIPGLDLFVTAESEERVFRYRWHRDGWRRTTVGTAGFSGGDICLGPGRSDRAIRLYQSSKDAHIYEFTLRNGRWHTSDIGSCEPTGGMGVTVGAGRGDRVRRVYACSPDGPVVEFTYARPDDTPCEDEPGEAADALTATPNPFSGPTVLCGTRELAASARAKVVDSNGRLVRTISADQLPDGRLSWRWDGTDESGRRPPSGCYFCVVQAGSGTVRRRLQLLP